MIFFLLRIGTANAAAEPEQQTKGGFVPPTYVRGKERKKAFADIRADLEREISALYEESQEVITPAVVERAKEAEQKVESLFDWAEAQRQTREIKAFKAELARIKRDALAVQRQIEEAHIALLLLVA